jgi:ribonucleoside-diphosphate reductase alpha chain
MEDDIAAQVTAAAFTDATSPNGAHATRTAPVARVTTHVEHATNPAPASAHTAQEVQTAAIQAVLADKMGDAPLCDTCGHITVRNGSCYRCLNCGDSKGCS